MARLELQMLACCSMLATVFRLSYASQRSSQRCPRRLSFIGQIGCVTATRLTQHLSTWFQPFHQGLWLSPQIARSDFAGDAQNCERGSWEVKGPCRTGRQLHRPCGHLRMDSEQGQVRLIRVLGREAACRSAPVIINSSEVFRFNGTQNVADIPDS